MDIGRALNRTCLPFTQQFNLETVAVVGTLCPALGEYMKQGCLSSAWAFGGTMCSREVNCGGGEESRCSLGLLAVLLHAFQMLQSPWTPPTGLQVVAGFQDSLHLHQPWFSGQLLLCKSKLLMCSQARPWQASNSTESESCPPIGMFSVPLRNKVPGKQGILSPLPVWHAYPWRQGPDSVSLLTYLNLTTDC